MKMETVVVSMLALIGGLGIFFVVAHTTEITQWQPMPPIKEPITTTEPPATIIEGCRDTDGGLNLQAPLPYVKSPGVALEGDMAYADKCIPSTRNSKFQRGSWIQEFYCQDDKAVSRNYPCADYGMECLTTETGVAYCG